MGEEAAAMRSRIVVRFVEREAARVGGRVISGGGVGMA